MIRIAFACLLVATAAVAGVKLATIPTTSPALARSVPAPVTSAPQIDPAALTRSATRDLATESWNPI